MNGRLFSEDEEFVTYPQAEALKKCGFDWKCSQYYDYYGDLWNLDKPMGQSKGNSFSLAPTQALAQKWLRDVHNIHIQVSYTQNAHWKWKTEIASIPINPESGYKLKVIDVFHGYEAALSAGIDAALERIKQN